MGGLCLLVRSDTATLARTTEAWAREGAMTCWARSRIPCCVGHAVPRGGITAVRDASCRVLTGRVWCGIMALGSRRARQLRAPQPLARQSHRGLSEADLQRMLGTTHNVASVSCEAVLASGVATRPLRPSDV